VRNAGWVEHNCGNDLSVLLSSGFQAAPREQHRTVLKVTPIKHAKCYEVRCAAVIAGNTPGPLQIIGLYTSSRVMKINGLTPGTTYMFQVRAIGESTRYSDWINPVSRMCA
jgi:hypothetical protein